MARMFEGLGAVSFIKKSLWYKNQLAGPIGTSIAYQVRRLKNMLNKKMTTDVIHGDKYYVFVQSV